MAQNMILNMDFRAYEQELRRRDESYWQNRGERRALALFKKAAELVPAYRDFLKKNHLQPHKIRSVKDFSHIPHTDKEQYIQAYPLQKRCWNGVLPESGIIAASSGTSGTPNFWLRGSEQEREAAFLHQFIYHHCCGVGKESTLVIIGFPLGVYVSGVATLLPSWAIARNSKLIIISTGTNKGDVLLALRTYAVSYKTIILAGHPYFIKDILETGIAEGNMPSIHRVVLLFASEGFSEQWRLYVRNMLAPYTKNSSIVSIYGSSEFLIMAHETPDSIIIKEKLEENASVCSVFQYHPYLRFFESVSEELLCTAGGVAPLIRYAIHDAGSILLHKEAVEMLGDRNPQWRLPFLLLNGRSDQALVFYAANIYPEHVRQALDFAEFHHKITGKFTLRKRQLSSMDQRFEVMIECRPRTKSTTVLKNTIQKRVYSHLLRANKEYLFISQHLRNDVRPHVFLRPYQDPSYFKQGVKPRYIQHT